MMQNKFLLTLLLGTCVGLGCGITDAFSETENLESVSEAISGTGESKVSDADLGEAVAAVDEETAKASGLKGHHRNWETTRLPFGVTQPVSPGG